MGAAAQPGAGRGGGLPGAFHAGLCLRAEPVHLAEPGRAGGAGAGAGPAPGGNQGRHAAGLPAGRRPGGHACSNRCYAPVGRWRAAWAPGSASAPGAGIAALCILIGLVKAAAVLAVYFAPGARELDSQLEEGGTRCKASGTLATEVAARATNRPLVAGYSTARAGGLGNARRDLSRRATPRRLKSLQGLPGFPAEAKRNNAFHSLARATLGALAGVRRAHRRRTTCGNARRDFSRRATLRRLKSRQGLPSLPSEAGRGKGFIH